MASARVVKRGSSLGRYGAFSRDGEEFIIKRPTTPWPWINYLTNDQYCAIISQCASGYSFYKDCRTDRVTRWLPENYKVDRPGRYLYIKDCSRLQAPGSRQKTRSQQPVWSATYQPMKVAPEFFEARHGMGYTSIRSRTYGLESELTFFVPREHPCEVWMVRLTNQSPRTRQLELFPYVEWLLGDYHLELRYRNIMNLYNRVWYEPRTHIVFAKKTAAWGDLNIRPFVGTAFFASSLPVEASETPSEVWCLSGWMSGGKRDSLLVFLHRSKRRRRTGQDRSRAEKCTRNG